MAWTIRRGPASQTVGLRSASAPDASAATAWKETTYMILLTLIAILACGPPRVVGGDHPAEPIPLVHDFYPVCWIAPDQLIGTRPDGRFDNLAIYDVAAGAVVVRPAVGTRVPRAFNPHGYTWLLADPWIHASPEGDRLLVRSGSEWSVVSLVTGKRSVRPGEYARVVWMRGGRWLGEKVYPSRCTLTVHAAGDTPLPVREIPVPGGSSLAGALSQDFALMYAVNSESAAENGPLWLWKVNLRTGKVAVMPQIAPIRELPEIFSVALSPDGKMLALLGEDSQNSSDPLDAAKPGSGEPPMREYRVEVWLIDLQSMSVRKVSSTVSERTRGIFGRDDLSRPASRLAWRPGRPEVTYFLHGRMCSVKL